MHYFICRQICEAVHENFFLLYFHRISEQNRLRYEFKANRKQNTEQNIKIILGRQHRTEHKRKNPRTRKFYCLFTVLSRPHRNRNSEQNVHCIGVIQWPIGKRPYSPHYFGRSLLFLAQICDEPPRHRNLNKTSIVSGKSSRLS